MTGRQLSALRIARPAEWEEIVRGASSAGDLGVSQSTWGRWRAELGLGVRRGGARVGAGRKKKDSARVNQSVSVDV